MSDLDMVDIADSGVPSNRSDSRRNQSVVGVAPATCTRSSRPKTKRTRWTVDRTIDRTRRPISFSERNRTSTLPAVWVQPSLLCSLAPLLRKVSESP